MTIASSTRRSASAVRLSLGALAWRMDAARPIVTSFTRPHVRQSALKSHQLRCQLLDTLSTMCRFHQVEVKRSDEFYRLVSMLDVAVERGQVIPALGLTLQLLCVIFVCACALALPVYAHPIRSGSFGWRMQRLRCASRVHLWQLASSRAHQQITYD